MESTLLKSVLLALAKFRNARFFRNNTGRGWAGKVTQLQPGKVLVSGAHPLDAGLCKGSSDLIGWVSVEIPPEWVGSKIAVFAAIETKSPTGRVSAEQSNFIEQVKNSGGIAGVARSTSEAAEIINKFVPIAKSK